MTGKRETRRQCHTVVDTSSSVVAVTPVHNSTQLSTEAAVVAMTRKVTAAVDHTNTGSECNAQENLRSVTKRNDSS